MLKPNCWKLKDYLKSIHEWTIENENKDKTYHYFPVTSLDLAGNMELIEDYYERNRPVVEVLWAIMDKKHGYPKRV